MSPDAQPTRAISLSRFTPTRVLNEDPHSKTINILGTYPSGTDKGDEDGEEPAILLLTKTHFDALKVGEYVGRLGEVKVLGVNDIYTWLLAWHTSASAAEHDASTADVKLTLIRNATDVHIRKYSRQRTRMVHETPEIYRQVVKPWVDAIPASRIQWVHNLLSPTPTEPLLLSTPHFILLPDLKWDQRTLSSLYLVAIVRDHGLKSMRDLRGGHVGMLRDVRREAGRVVRERWGVGRGEVRMWVHYPPSYYHLHVHITALASSQPGASVGQAHLLDDIISLLELDPEEGPGVMERRTLTYVLGEEHGLWKGLAGAQTEDRLWEEGVEGAHTEFEVEIC